MEKLFNEHYTKAFELPTAFTAMNGAIQYFKMTVNADLVAEGKSDAEKAAAQANYLRVLEILRSRGPQPIITSAEAGTEGNVGKTFLKFTVEQVWAYGNREKEQVSDHSLASEAKAEIESMFVGIKPLAWVGDELVPSGGTDMVTTGGVEILETVGDLCKAYR